MPRRLCEVPGAGPASFLIAPILTATKLRHIHNCMLASTSHLARARSDGEGPHSVIVTSVGGFGGGGPMIGRTRGDITLSWAVTRPIDPTRRTNQTWSLSCPRFGEGREGNRDGRMRGRIRKSNSMHDHLLDGLEICFEDALASRTHSPLFFYALGPPRDRTASSAIDLGLG